MKKSIKLAGSILLLASFIQLTGCKEKENAADTIKVGILHSLTGTMAISEKPVRDSELLAIKEINEAGGILGKKIKVIEEDGESNPEVFEKKAEKLLSEDKVLTVFGCWTSASRKAVKPIFEEHFGLLWYPLQYEGIEASPNIMYMGASPNQQVVPAIDYCAENFGKRMYLLGSDYIFPRTANKIIKAQLGSMDGSVVGETYVPMGHSDFASVIEEIKSIQPDVVINTLNGDSNIAFFSQLKQAGLSSEKLHIMSFSISEEEIRTIGVENLEGQLVAWNYFETTKTARNEKFVESYKNEYGQDRVTGDPIEAGYIAVYMWAAACKKAKSFDVEDVRIASKGLSFNAPEGTVTIDGGNQHLYKQVRIGKINEKGLIDEIWASTGVIRPDPYLSTYEWARGL